MGGKASAWVVLCLVLAASMNEVANGSSDCYEHCFTECRKINRDPYSCAVFCKKNCDQNTPYGRRLLFSHLVDKINKDTNLDWIKKIKQ